MARRSAHPLRGRARNQARPLGVGGVPAGPVLPWPGPPGEEGAGPGAPIGRAQGGLRRDHGRVRGALLPHTGARMRQRAHQGRGVQMQAPGWGVRDPPGAGRSPGPGVGLP